jgi:hypothetical protein
MRIPKSSNSKYPTSGRIDTSKKLIESAKKVSIVNEKKSTISRSSMK